ncbi:MAG TPA: aspartyl protease family protein [Caulobacteraceae bacterium]
MKRHRIAAAAFAAMGLLAAWPASADCVLKAVPIPVKMKGLRPLVAAKINGKEAEFLLDSGSVIDTLSGKFAAELKLKPFGVDETGTRVPVAGRTAIEGAAGRGAINGVVKADKFEFVGASFHDVPFMATDNVRDVDGLIGQAFLQDLDVEYDLREGVVRLAKPEGCKAANMAYWAKVGEAYSIAPLEWVDRVNPHTEAAIYVNGVRLRAVFDTGSPISMITQAAAARAGVKTSDPGVVEMGDGLGVDGAFRSWAATFKTVKVGDEEIHNANLTIGQSSTDWFDVLLGADFFLSHRIYVANSQGMIYFTYSGGPAFRTPAPKPTAAAAAAAQ